jgi:hypothetical protein
VGVPPELCEVHFLVPRLHQLDEENSELRSCTPCLKANIERLEEVSLRASACVGGRTDPVVGTNSKNFLLPYAFHTSGGSQDMHWGL